MKTIFNKFKLYFVFLFIILFLIIFNTLLNIIGISYTITNIFSIITLLILFFIYGYKKSNNSTKGQIIKNDLIIILIMFIFSLIIGFDFTELVYYLLLILSSILGFTLNKKNK